MTSRRNLLLLGVAAAVVAGAVVALTPSEPPATAVAGPRLAFPGLAEKLPEVRRIELTRGNDFLALDWQAGRFVLPVRSDYPARQERVREALVGLTELRLLEPRTADPAQHERLGVDDPARDGTNAVGLRLLDAAAKPIAELVVGRRRVRTQGGLPESVYVRRPGESQSWLAEGRLVVDTDPNLWLDRDIVNLSAAELAKVTSRPHDGPELVAGTTPDRGLQLVTPASTSPIDDAKLEEVARALEFLTFQEVVPESQIPGEPLGEARFEFRDGLVVTVWPSRDRQGLWLRLRAEGGGAAERLDARWRGWAFQVGTWKERTVLPRLPDLLATGPAEPPAPR